MVGKKSITVDCDLRLKKKRFYEYIKNSLPTEFYEKNT